MYSGKTCDKLVDQSVRAIETSVPDPEARAAIYRDASERARALAPKVPGFDGARAPSKPSEGIHPKIAKAVQRAKTEVGPPFRRSKSRVRRLLCSRQGKVSGRKVRKAPLRNARVRLNG